MIDENCGHHHVGYCLKGLPGILCEVVGCVAHSTASYLSFSDKDTKGVPMSYFVSSNDLKAGDNVKVITIKED